MRLYREESDLLFICKKLIELLEWLHYPFMTKCHLSGVELYSKHYFIKEKLFLETNRLYATQCSIFKTD
ncbi:unnamed protein product [Heterobilharzia americana]|nr:unnamed protein product [Heterobilharzia americana]